MPANSAVVQLDYPGLVNWTKNLSGLTDSQLDEWINTAAQYDINEMQAVEDLASGYMNFSKAADGTYDWSTFATTVQQPINTTLPNSNASKVSRGSVLRALGRKASELGKIELTKAPAAGAGMGANAMYFLGTTQWMLGAVSAGITLGKTVDGALYNLMPDYWDSIGISSLNPETWSSITTGDDSWQAGLINYLLGINPDTGEGQMYMDSEALAYMAYALSQNSWFEEGSYIVNEPVDGIDISYAYPYPIKATYGTQFWTHSNGNSSNTHLFATDVPVYHIYSSYYIPQIGRTADVLIRCSLEPFMAGYSTRTGAFPPPQSSFPTPSTQVSTTTVNGETIYVTYTSAPFSSGTLNATNLIETEKTSVSIDITVAGRVAYNVLFGSILEPKVPGTGNQSSATLPDTSTWTDIPTTVQSLQQQYPDLYNNAITWDNVQPDGTNATRTYVPVSLPNALNWNDTKPTTSTQTQSSTRVDPDNQTLIDLLMKTITQTQTQPDSDVDNPPQNPIDTGTGDSPSVTLPIGQASKLWSVYHPTQAQIDSFGSWLWSTQFIDVIQKLFQNPIDGVISLQKIYVTPIDAGVANISVGNLDSGVSSETVVQQYVEVDCGTVNCYEDFGNVFDYPPFTQVSLYLPFIGIVPLDTNDVMRSSIHVIYGVDIFTGACLARVEVIRDANTVNLYQYAGVCSVSYPLTNVQYTQMAAGMLSVAAGIASMVASGGVSAPAALATMGGVATGSKTTVGRSGGFSGNAGALGIKKPYIILQRPQTKVAELFPELSGYPTNVSAKLGDFGGHVRVSHVHVEGINATDTELVRIESLLKSGVIV